VVSKGMCGELGRDQSHLFDRSVMTLTNNSTGWLKRQGAKSDLANAAQTASGA